MKRRTIVVLGAGIGGKVVALGIKWKYPKNKVVLVGPESNSPEGLFYFNRKIPGISMYPVEVDYRQEGCPDNPMEVYQKKSRGEYDPKVKVSSLSKVGTTEIGYFLDRSINWQLLDAGVIWIKENVTSINFSSKKVRTDHDEGTYDDLISTIPFNVLVKLIYDYDISPQLKYQPIYVKKDIYDDYLVIDRIIVTYDLTDSPYYRISSYQGYIDLSDDKVTVEKTSESINKVDDTCIAMYPGKIIPSDLYIERAGRRIKIDAETIEKLFDFKIVGRYARWDYHYTVDQSYYDTIEYLSTKYEDLNDN